ncbi:hypothetical protein FBBNIHIM_23240 [Pseudocitrobacter vendiensis]|uniref:Uncharacterized protein n=1 Tax=Pseudocitrobacter vendiensis TaxID=2488306 RepID=A0ABM9FFL7_9ENTR|nr:hypothetical protein FBBNIHIM_23240 [Pseudocitrobacter vendiensis]
MQIKKYMKTAQKAKKKDRGAVHQGWWNVMA